MTTSTNGKKVLAVLYDGGAPAKREPRLLAASENALGLRPFLEGLGYEYIVTSDKEGANSMLDKHLADAEILISTPFHPAYLTAERIARAPKLKLAVTAGVGSDHVDLIAAAAAGLTVAEVTGSNVVSVAEHVVMMILDLVRNFVPAHLQATSGAWDVAAICEHAYDLENKVVGTLGCGRIGQRVMQRLQGFDCKELLYSDYAQLPKETEAKLKLRYVTIEELFKVCDVVTVNCPLHKDSLGLVNAKLINSMRKGAYIVNTARGAICNKEDVAAALQSGQLGGYAGDVWDVQPAPKDHCWRQAPNNAMTPHYSGTTLDAQARYAAGTKDIIDRFVHGRELNVADVIVNKGKLAPQYDKTSKDHSLVHTAGWEAQTKVPV